MLKKLKNFQNAKKTCRMESCGQTPVKHLRSGVQLAEKRGERSPLPFFENRKKVPDFAKKITLVLKKRVLFVCVYGLNSHLKFSFKSI